MPLGAAIMEELRHRVGRLVPFSHPGMFAKQVRRASGWSGFILISPDTRLPAGGWEAGGNLAVLQAILGHSSIVVTQRYARLSDEAILAEARRVAGQAQKQAQGSRNAQSKAH